MQALVLHEANAVGFYTHTRKLQWARKAGLQASGLGRRFVDGDGPTSTKNGNAKLGQITCRADVRAATDIQGAESSLREPESSSSGRDSAAFLQEILRLLERLSEYAIVPSSCGIGGVYSKGDF